jgi:hypothetical protein
MDQKKNGGQSFSSKQNSTKKRFKTEELNQVLIIERRKQNKFLKRNKVKDKCTKRKKKNGFFHFFQHSQLK